MEPGLELGLGLLHNLFLHPPWGEEKRIILAIRTYSEVDNGPGLEIGGLDILGAREHKDLLYFFSFSLSSGVIR